MQTAKRKRIAFYLFYAGLVLLVASLPLSKFMMSIAQFLIAGGWLLDGDVTDKFKRFFKSKIALVLASLYLLHLTGLIYTTDFNYAWKDLRIKLPLLLMPLLLSTAPRINQLQFNGILLALIGGVTISTVISWLIFKGVVVRDVNDIRDISIFISHIRLALLCCLSFIAIVWLIYKNYRASPRKYYFLLTPLLPWFVCFMILIESLTGLVILTVTSMVILNWLVFRYGGITLRSAVVVVSLVIPFYAFVYVRSVNQTFIVQEIKDLPEPGLMTASGNPYVHYADREEYENGNAIWNYICAKELEQQWNTRSRLSYTGRDERNQELNVTLIRFLSSKGLRKDSAGIWSLTKQEIRSVEMGITNVDYQTPGNITARIHQVLWELQQYQKTGDPSGHSVAQRFEFWKAATGIIGKNKAFGVGTGDIPAAFREQYIEMNTRLREDWRLRAHNQYLSIAVTFGITGLILFLFSLAYPFYKQSRRGDLLFISFSIISAMSMLTEDTLETQAGVTFFALFTSLFLFVNPNNPTAGVNLQKHN
ncbi:MAG: O-antigen ligase family protein [Bacteroidota bacterium]|nr:O-antigen ligase family protein [Bacteroidota bacterium]